MRYLATMSAEIRFWHSSIDARSIERAFSKRAKNKHSVGIKRPRGDKSPYLDSYCSFVVSKPKKTDIEALLAACLKIVKMRSNYINTLMRSGGRMVFIIQVYGNDWVQMNLSPEYLENMANLSVTLAIESHDDITGVSTR